MSTYVVHGHGEGQAETADQMYGPFRSQDRAQAFADAANDKVGERSQEAQHQYHIFFQVHLVYTPDIDELDWDME